MSNKAVAHLLHLHAHTVKDLEPAVHAGLAGQDAAAGTRRSSAWTNCRSRRATRIASWSATWSGTADLVRGTGPLRSRSGSVLCRAGPEEDGPDSVGGHGHVEGVPQLGAGRHAPQAQILFDKFHILRHLADAMDQVRRREYQRVAAKDRAFIKGQRYTLLSHWANLTLAGRDRSGSCCGPTSDWPRPTCSRSRSGNSGPITVKAGPASSLPAGESSSSGNGSGPLRSSPR